ncbi:MAG TPA: ABC transporter substrate-binding protein [Chloroflexota bacterium]|nr:ABC transporter substrate-binding protein [Chloroflexota bacterium]
MRLRCLIPFIGVLLLASCGGQAAAPGSGAPASAARPSAAAVGSSAPASTAAVGSAAAKPAGQGTHLTMSYSQLAGDQMVPWVAKESGIFAQNGLNVDNKLVASTTGISALIGGDVDLATIGGSEAMGAAAGGADVAIVANLAPVYTFKLMVGPDIKTKDDLVGKKLGFTRPGSTTDTGTRDLLKKIGLQPDKDVSMVPLGADKASTVAALLNGTVQGILQQPPDNLETEDKGYHGLYDLASMGLPAAAAVVVAQRSWIAAHHDVMQKFMDSLVQATIREKKDPAIGEAVIRKYYKTDDERTVKYMYEYHSAIHPVLPYPKLEQFADIIPAIKAQNKNAENFDFAHVLDPSFVQSAADRGLDKS